MKIVDKLFNCKTQEEDIGKIIYMEREIEYYEVSNDNLRTLNAEQRIVIEDQIKTIKGLRRMLDSTIQFKMGRIHIDENSR